MRTTTFTTFCIFLLLYPGHVLPLRAGEIVENWAELLGQELWDLARNITNSAKIKEHYISSNAQVEKKDPENLLSTIVANITKMLKRKMDAVRCMMQAAEETAEAYVYNETDTEFMYYSTKYSFAINPESGQNYTPKLPESIKDNSFMYMNMTLIPDTHFHNIEVDTSHSVVQVPTNIYDRSEAVQTFIEWSQDLDDVFVLNYNSDPALSWQYFCSSSGVMRHFPALHWSQEIDLFDCRTRSWFIEAATCSKDVVILFDNSGSMTGYWNTLARFTVSRILDTFSNNDFINILSYSDTVKPLVECFNETLVQATLENIQIFKDKIVTLQPEGYANLGIAMTQAFKILNESRIRNDCGEEGFGCNQAIMLVTDGVPNNVTEVFEEYNWLQNGSIIPVRIFTYLIGREVSNVEEITWMACLNRGYFVHIRSLGEAMDKVLKYIPVIARPLVLQAEEHPTSWTHAYIKEGTSEDKTEGFEDYRLFTSVAVPAYDRKANSNNESRVAELLGVAGTDVPIEDIEKLTLPYKLGVNGYAFIVTNNGYVLMHPNLRPVDEGYLNQNYNSIDLLEVEFLDDDLEPRRQYESKIMELREALVNYTEGSILGLPLKNFYDNMKRAYKEKYDYYYAPIPGSPFSLGIALPVSHGHYWLKVGDEIDKNLHLKIDIIKNYFSGTNWKIHPKWVYCKYHYLEGHEFETPEDELIHFLKIITKERNFTWPPSQYGEYDFTAEDVNDEEVECGRKSLDDDDYYCDEELMQHLVFDAKIMEEAFMPMDLNYSLLEIYDAKLKYVATMSGLTRWEYIYGEDNDTVMDFGDVHSNAIDETWYKSAILQHKIDPDSFIYSLTDDSSMIMGSHAIFPRDAGTEAPGCVVGFKFNHSRLEEKFKEFANIGMEDCEDCNIEWTKDMVDCYVIDNNGYVVLSEYPEHVSKFFGEIEGSVMEAMLINNTFENVTVYDLQAVCVRQEPVSNDGSFIMTPFRAIGWTLQWIFSRSMYLILETSLSQLWADIWVSGLPSKPKLFDNYDDNIDSNEDISTEDSDPSTTMDPTTATKKDKQNDNIKKEPEFINIPEPCDKQAILYILNQTKFIRRQEYLGEEKSLYSKPFFAKRIPHSNLLLVIVLANHSSNNEKLSAAKTVITYDEIGNQSLCYHKLKMNRLPRRKLTGCYSEHPLEYEILMCGRSSLITINIHIIIASLTLFMYLLRV